MKRLTLLIAAFAIFQSPLVEAKNYYRYKDKAGNIVVKDYLPTHAVKAGYEVVNESGRVLEIVGPELTAKQKRLQAIRQEQLDAQAEARRKERQRDTLLLRQYQSVEDIERTKKSQTATLNINLRIVDNHTKSLKRKLEQQQKRAADYERRGKAVPEATLHEIAAIKNQITSNDDSITRYNQQINEIDAQFEKDRIRFQELKAEQYITESMRDPNQIDVKDIFACETRISCDKAWSYAQVFAHENASRPLSIVTNTLIVSRKPEYENEIALSITRVPNKETDEGMNIVMSIQCHPSESGQKKCGSSDVVALKQRFIDYLSSR
ncbi:hypothetical protein [Kangiella sp. TOML190]|uniref:hypothetical protein n=1 Tax=Kangiella sp. TOML190 TaxID=2931351 RepID=UPI00204220C9|nr:hypothetical protein [Kangiella sp. TOML190]